MGTSGLHWYSMGFHGIKQPKNGKNPLFLRGVAVDNFGEKIKNEGTKQV